MKENEKQERNFERENGQYEIGQKRYRDRKREILTMREGETRQSKTEREKERE